MAFDSNTAEGLRLVRAFSAIKDKSARKALIALAESCAALAQQTTGFEEKKSRGGKLARIPKGVAKV
jgi:hypothetical protein